MEDIELMQMLSDLSEYSLENEQLGNQVWEKTKELDKVLRSLREVALSWMPIEKSVSKEGNNLKSNDLTSKGIVLKEDELLKMAQIKQSLKEIKQDLEQEAQRINRQISEFTSSSYWTCHDEGMVILSLEEFGYKKILQAKEIIYKTLEFLADIDFSPTKVQQDLLSSQYLPKLLLVASEKIEETARETRQAANVFQLTNENVWKLREKLTKNKSKSN